MGRSFVLKSIFQISSVTRLPWYTASRFLFEHLKNDMEQREGTKETIRGQ